MPNYAYEAICFPCYTRGHFLPKEEGEGVGGTHALILLSYNGRQ